MATTGGGRPGLVKHDQFGTAMHERTMTFVHAMICPFARRSHWLAHGDASHPGAHNGIRDDEATS